MALTLSAKPSGSVYRYTWVVPVAVGDSVASATLTVSSGTAVIDSYSVDDNDVIAFISGGTNGATTTITASAVTDDGETITETIYLPVRDSAPAAANTANDICAFALRKIAGIGEDADAAELVVALELLNDMIAEWRMDGMDLGTPAPLAADDSLTMPDEFLSAVKYNLTVLVAEELGRELSPTVVNKAERGKMLVSNRLFAFADLGFEGPLLYSFGTVQ